MNKKKCDKCDAENLSSSKYCANCGYELSKHEENTTTQNVDPPQKAKNKNISSIIGVVFGLLVCFGIQQFFFKQPSFDKLMVRFMNETNKNCPIMVDSETRLDNVAVLPSKTIQYNYTILSVEVDAIDTLEVKTILEPNILNNVRTNPQMKILRDNKVSFNYYYKDKNGVYLFGIKVKPDQYNSEIKRGKF